MRTDRGSGYFFGGVCPGVSAPADIPLYTTLPCIPPLYTTQPPSVPPLPPPFCGQYDRQV